MAAERIRLDNLEPTVGCGSGDRIGLVLLGMPRSEQQEWRRHDLPATGGGKFGQPIVDRGADHLEVAERHWHTRQLGGNEIGNLAGLGRTDRVGGAMANHEEADALRQPCGL